MKTINRLLFVVLAIVLYSCEDIIEEDITNDNLTIVYPKNNEQIESNVVNFQWESLKGADKYRLQVFSESQNMVLDSLVNKNNFTYPLTAGKYQWRVRGENFAYETAYTFPASFTLIATTDLSKQQVQLAFPQADLYTKETSFTFSWTALSAAEYYVFQLINVTSGNLLVLEKSDLTGSSFTLPVGTITEDGQYLWKLKAVNSESETETPFATRTFYVDRVVPNQSQNLLPLNNSIHIIDSPVNFTWTVPADTGVVISPVTYVIQIASDQNFTNIIQTAPVPNPEYIYTFSSIGDYYWRVKTVDKAKNESNYSTHFKLTVKEQ